MTRPAPSPDKPAVQRAQDAERIQFTPTNTFRVISEGGPGLPDFFEEHARRGDGPPLHSHPWPSWELCIEGQLRVKIGHHEFQIGPGDAVYIPPNTPHTYVVESDTARTVGVNLSDGRFPQLQGKAAVLLAASDGPDFQKVGALALEHQVEILGPPLAAEGE